MIEIDEVLEARIASGFRNGRSDGEDLALDLLVLGRRLDHESQSPSLSSVDAKWMRSRTALRAGLVELALWRPGATGGR